MLLFDRRNAKNFDKYLINSMGFTIDLLVEQAGMSISSAIEKYLSLDLNKCKYTEINIFAGKGNNGLDAFACARILSARNYKVKIWEIPDETSTNEKISVQKQLCISSGIEIESANKYDSRSNQIIVDGLFGVSFNLSRGVNENYAGIFKKINESQVRGSYVFSIDIPSGVEPDTGELCENAIKANETVTFIFPKPGIMSFPGRGNAGKITIDKINIPSIIIDNYCIYNKSQFKYSMTDIEFARDHILPRKEDSHKGSFGKVGIFGGSSGMAGAVCISTMSAIKSGAGLVYMTVPEEIYADSLKAIPEALISKNYDEILNRPDVIAIGPGLNENDINAEIVIQKAVETFPKLILDAGALNIISKNITKYINLFKEREKSGLAPAILTPHPGEMGRLLPETVKYNRIQAALYASDKLKSIIVYKGAGTIIASPQESVCINSNGNTALARGGSGDVLTGIISSLYAVNESPFISASLGVFVHGLSGDITSQSQTEISSSIHDIINNLPNAYKMILEGEKNKCRNMF